MKSFASRWTLCVLGALLLLAWTGCRPSTPAKPPEAVEPPPSAFHEPVRLEDNKRPQMITFYVRDASSTRQGVLFSLYSPPAQAESWKSDGTRAGTIPLGVSMRPGLDADTRAAGFILGSEDSTERLWRLKDGVLNPSFVMEAPVEVRKLGGRYLALMRSTLVSFSEDGTREVLAELASGQGTPRFVAPLAGRLFFADGAKQLWVTDGTQDGTRFVYAFGPESEIFQAAAAGSRLVLLVRVGSTVASPRPWASDGTPGGTYLIEDLPVDSSHGASVLSAGAFVVVTSGCDLRATDGTPGPLRILPLTGAFGCSDILLLARAGSGALFSASDATGRGLWRTDGTPEGTLRLMQGNFDMAVTVGDGAYFTGLSGLGRTDGSVEGTTVLETESVQLGEPVEGVVPYIHPSSGSVTLRIATGTVRRILAEVPPGTQILGRTPSHAWVLYARPASLFSVDESTGGQTVLPMPPTAQGTAPNRLMAAQDTLFFTFKGQIIVDPRAPQTFVDLRASDGSAESTRTVVPGQPYFCPDCPRPLELVPMAAIQGTLFFQTALGALAAVNSEGTYVDVHPDLPYAQAVPFHDRLLFLSRSAGGADSALWAAERDGTRTTELFAFTGSGYWVPDWFDVSGDRVFFSVSRKDSWSSELWVYDEAVGPAPLASYSRGYPLAHAPSLRGVVFTCTTPGTGRELCASDGTPQGTVFLGDLRPGAESSAPGDLVRFRDHVSFTADDGVHGRELWVTDGTPEGTRLAFDLIPGLESSEPGYLAAGDNRLYFRARTPELGAELWALEPQSPPVPLTDTMPGERNGLPPRPMAVRKADDWLVFAARTPQNGDELWVSNGTRDGTRLLADVLPGPQSSAPSELVIAPSHLYFRATDATHGPVPWASRRRDAPQ